MPADGRWQWSAMGPVSARAHRYRRAWHQPAVALRSISTLKRAHAPVARTVEFLAGVLGVAAVLELDELHRREVGDVTFTITRSTATSLSLRPTHTHTQNTCARARFESTRRNARIRRTPNPGGWRAIHIEAMLPAPRKKSSRSPLDVCSSRLPMKTLQEFGP